jgi:putative protein kinase ArgK-like GTPase of G3E family
MVDAERLVAVLSRVTARLRILDEYAQQERGALLGDRVRLGDLKYTFQTAISIFSTARPCGATWRR